MPRAGNGCKSSLTSDIRTKAPSTSVSILSTVPLTKAEQQQFDKLQAEYDTLNGARNESDDEEAPERLEELEKLISAISEDRDGVLDSGNSLRLPEPWYPRLAQAR